MKKATLALLTATFVLTGCNDKESNDLKLKLQTSEQRISQLQNELNNLNNQVPSLKTTPVTLFELKEEFKLNPKPDDEFSYTNTSIDYSVNSVETNIDWLDQLLYKALVSTFYDDKNNLTYPEDAEKKKQILALAPKEQLLKIIKLLADEDYCSAKAGESLGYAYNIDLDYIGQRYNLLTFTKNVYQYGGGAHGTGWVEYINIDTNKKAILRLNDVIPINQQVAVKELLWQVYLEHNRDLKPTELYINKADFYLSEHFYFNQNGITFVYPPYAIGPYAEGIIPLTLSWFEAGKLINPEYKW